MENGVEIFDDAGVGERKGAHDGIAKEKEPVSLVDVKESEGDEVFEEAIEPETPGFHIENVVVSEGGNTGYFRNVNSDSRVEVDNFEEAVEASHEIQQTDDGSHETTDAEADEDPSVAKSENGGLDNLNLGNTQSHDDAQETIKDQHDGEVHKILGIQDANEAKGGNDSVQKQVHSYRDALLGDEVNAEVTETSNIQPTGHQDFVNVHKDVSVSSVSILKDERGIQLEEVQSHHFELLKSDVKDKEPKDLAPNDNSTTGHLGELNPRGEKEKSVISKKLINVSNKNEEQMDCPIDTAAPAQIGRPCVNVEVKEEELSGAVLISQGCLDEQDIASDDVTTYQGLNETESPAVELVNLNDKVQEYTKEQKDVLNCDATDHQDLKGEESSAVAIVNSNDKIQEYAEEQRDASDHQVLTGKDSPAAGVSNLNDKVQLYMEQQKDVLSSDTTDDQILSVKASPDVGLVISNDKVDEQKHVSVSCISASENNTENSAGEAVTAEDENRKSSEGSVSNNYEKSGISTPEFASVSSKVSQPPLAGAIIGVNKAVAQESEKPDIKERKQNVTGLREPEAGSARDLSSTSGSSVTRTPPPAQPAGLGRAAPLLEPSPRVVQQTRANGAAPSVQNQLVEEPTNGESEENDEVREKLQMIRVKFLRLAHRLGQHPHNVVVAQVLYRLGLAEQLGGGDGSRVAAFSFLALIVQVPWPSNLRQLDRKHYGSWENRCW